MHFTNCLIMSWFWTSTLELNALFVLHKNMCCGQESSLAFRSSKVFYTQTHLAYILWCAIGILVYRTPNCSIISGQRADIEIRNTKKSRPMSKVLRSWTSPGIPEFHIYRELVIQENVDIFFSGKGNRLDIMF